MTAPGGKLLISFCTMMHKVENSQEDQKSAKAKQLFYVVMHLLTIPFYKEKADQCPFSFSFHVSDFVFYTILYKNLI